MKNIQLIILSIIIFTIPAKGQESLHSDFFEVKIIKTSKKIYDNGGTNGGMTVSVWRPIPPNGYSTFGDMIVRQQNPTENQKPITIAVKPKPGFEYLLRPAVDYEFVWDNRGSGGAGPVTVNRLVCPQGYVALGMIAFIPTTQNEDTKCKCIKEIVIHRGKTFRLVSRANYASENKNSQSPFYQNHGTDANRVVSLWKPVIRSKPGKGIVSIPPNTFFANGASQSKIPGDTPYALNLKFDIDMDEKLSVNSDKIVLNSNTRPSVSQLKRLGETKTYYVPFFAVQDDQYTSQLKQFLKSPTYKIVRTSYFKYLEGMTTDRNAGATADQAYSITTGLTSETHKETAVGVTAGMSVTTSVEASAGLEGVASAKVGVSTTISLETSLSYSWGGSTSSSVQESRTPTFKVPPGVYSVIFQRTSDYQIYRKDRSQVGEGFSVDQYDFVQKIYKP